MKEAQVVLVAPNTLGSYKFSGKKRENLALGCLGAYLQQNNVTSELIDARFDNLTQEQVVEEVVRLHPILVGLTFMEQEPAIWSQPLVKALKKELPKTHIVAGSYFPTLDPVKCLDIVPEIDSIAQGEGEETLLELVLRTSKGQEWRSVNGIAFKEGDRLRQNPRRRPIPDLNILPEPLRYADGDQMSKVTLEGSRGCFSRCTFCSINPHLNPGRSAWRGKGPQSIVNELVHLRNKYPNINQYRFADADFVGLGRNYERLEELGRSLLNAGFSNANSKLFIETQSRNVLGISPSVWELLHNAGLYQIFIGVETGSREIKKQLAKASSTDDDIKAIDYLKSFGFNVTYGFIMIAPWSKGLEDVMLNIDTLRRLGNAGLDKYFSELILTPGTRAFELASQENDVYIEKVEGTDHYLYHLPHSLEMIRQFGKYMLEHPMYRSFLEKIAYLYSQIDNLRLNGLQEDAKSYLMTLDQINLEIFLKIIGVAGQESESFNGEQAEKILMNIIQAYEPKLVLLNKQLQQ